MDKIITNIAEATGKVENKEIKTNTTPYAESLYFEFADNTHVFQIGLKNILECILFAAKEKQIPNLPLTWYTEVCSLYDIPLSELLEGKE